MRIIQRRRAGKILSALANRGRSDTARLEPVVLRIIRDVQRHGDKALAKYARRWDSLGKNEPLQVSVEEMREAWSECPKDFRYAVKTAAASIRRFAEWQRPQDWRRRPNQGISLGQIAKPLRSVGCYVPGGRYPLPSTLLMTVVPAQVAGVEHITVVSPRPTQETLAVAGMLGIERFYRIGGAQAIAALAHGTQSITRVDKVVGPGNLYVTTAKKLIAFDCGIDFLAGPTEAVIVSRDGNPAFIAADLVAQAEHDPHALSMFITSSNRLAHEVATAVRAQAAGNVIAKQSLTRNGLIVVTETDELAMEIANSLAPEHLTVDPDQLSQVQCAGSVFVGQWSAQAAGDYGAGPNHVLPTGGMARWRGGLSVLDFVKLITVQEMDLQGLRTLAPSLLTLANSEGLIGHATSIQLRYGDA